MPRPTSGVGIHCPNRRSSRTRRSAPCPHDDIGVGQTKSRPCGGSEVLWRSLLPAPVRAAPCVGCDRSEWSLPTLPSGRPRNLPVVPDVSTGSDGGERCSVYSASSCSWSSSGTPALTPSRFRRLRRRQGSTAPLQVPSLAASALGAHLEAGFLRPALPFELGERGPFVVGSGQWLRSGPDRLGLLLLPGEGHGLIIGPGSVELEGAGGGRASP